MQKLIYKLLIASDIFHVKKEVLELQLKSHPESSSVKAISDTLDYFDIENIVANVPKDALSQLPNSFLAIIEKEKTSELVFVKLKQNSVITLNANHQKSKMSIAAFKEIWAGTIIAVEGIEKTKKPSVMTRYKNKIFLVFLMSFLAIQQFLDFDLTLLIYQLLGLAGIYISSIIIKEELGMHNATVAKLCNAVSHNSNCNEVIKSKKSSFLKILSLSDASISFFSALFLITTFIGFDSTVLFGIASVSVLVVLFSIYYQAMIVKKWCVLCLGISALLLAQFSLLAITIESKEISFEYIVKALAFAGVAVVLWSYLKPLIVDTKKLETTQTDFLKFKRSRRVFDFLLSQKKIESDIYIPASNQIIFGNPNAKIVIKAVFNPLCGYCTEPFQIYDTILTRNPKDVQIHFIFNVSDNEENIGNQISKRIIELYFEVDKNTAYTALKQWFANRDVKTWQQRFGISKSTINTEINNTIPYHVQWCIMNEINYTPATIIQKYLYPEEYQIEDLLLFIDDMILEAKDQPLLEEHG